MRRFLLACACCLTGLLAGCAESQPKESPNAPPPKTEVIKKPDGSHETKTSVPD